MKSEANKIFRGNASQFLVACELSRRGFAANVTLGNTPNTDVLCSNAEGTKFVHIQVKTFVPKKSKSVAVGRKAEKPYGHNFIWILVGLPEANQDLDQLIFYIIPAEEMSKNIMIDHNRHMSTLKKNGDPHLDSGMRIVSLPPRKSPHGWCILKYKNRWDTIESLLV